jgi:hypothetical protein
VPGVCAALHTLRDGSKTEDRRLDRLVQFDEASRGYAAVQVLPLDAKPRTKVWGLSWLLDQGREGACTNFALAHNRLGSPRPRKLGAKVAEVELLAFRLYGRSKQLDPWPGEAYDGTSMLAACKAWQEAKLLAEYRWAFGVDDLLLALAHLGPMCLATDWLEDMGDPPPTGLLRVSGRKIGGHAYDATGVVLYPERSTVWRDTGVRGEPLVVGPNSWGPHRSPRERPPLHERPWGRMGYWAMKASDVETLLRRRGEAVVPLDRVAA